MLLPFQDGEAFLTFKNSLKWMFQHLGHLRLLSISKVCIEIMTGLVEKSLIRNNMSTVSNTYGNMCGKSSHKMDQMEKRQVGMRKRR